MLAGLITIGDRTSHGGTVITGDATSTVAGKAMARDGDLTVCPKCKGVFPILKGDGIVTDDKGRTYARHLDATACGARVISSQASTVATELEDPALPPVAAPNTVAAPTTSGVCMECLVKAAATGASTVLRA